MKKGYELGGRHQHDPIGSEKSRGKARSQRKSGREGYFAPTPSEARKKERFLRQFRAIKEGEGLTQAYKESPLWCECDFGGMRGVDGKCTRCREDE